VQLPVYYSWQFHTGKGADFEALVNLLEARDPSDLPPEVGKRQIDISQPGFLITPPLPEGSTVDFEGALRLAESTVNDWTTETKTRFQGELKKILEVPWLAMKDGVDPLLAPPIYGCWNVGRHILNTAASPPAVLPWLDELNLDPRHRSVAALGTAVIQSEQEQLTASRGNARRDRTDQSKAASSPARPRGQWRLSRQTLHRFSETLLKVVAKRNRARRRDIAPAIKRRAMLSQRMPKPLEPGSLRDVTQADESSEPHRSIQRPGAAPIAIVWPQPFYHSPTLRESGRDVDR
jgi:hypothetical protein